MGLHGQHLTHVNKGLIATEIQILYNSDSSPSIIHSTSQKHAPGSAGTGEKWDSYLDLAPKAFQCASRQLKFSRQHGHNKVMDNMHNRYRLSGSHGAKMTVGSCRPREISKSTLISSLMIWIWCPCSTVQGVYWIWSTLIFPLSWSEYGSKLWLPRSNTGCSHETIVRIVHAVFKHHTNSKLKKRFNVAH
jgi:hypothetical protein